MGLRKTKLIATMGPSCEDPQLIEHMIEKGMDVARFNLSHGDLDGHLKLVESVREVAQRLGANVATLIDTRGNEIRIGQLRGGAAVLTAGADFSLCTEAGLGDESSAAISFESLPRAVQRDDRILIDDGKIELRVVGIREGKVDCKVECGGTLRDRKGVNLPDTDLHHEVMDPGTRADLGFAARSDAEYLAASFVQSARDVCDIRRFLEEQKADIPIIAKIENRMGVDRLDEIVAEANGTIADLERALTTEKRHSSSLDTQLKTLVDATGVSLAEITALPLIEGAVLQTEYSIAPGLVALNVGSGNGVQRGFTFDIYSGNAYKGQVRVESVRPGMCTALIVRTVSGQNISQGDSATTRL